MRGELDGVAHQVDEHLAQPRGVALHAFGHVGGDVDDELQPFFGGAGGHAAAGGGHGGAQGQRQPLQRQLAGLDLGEVQDVVEDGQQRLRRLLHHVQVLALHRLQRRAQHQLRQADDAVHGRAHLVAHVGHELALGAVGLLGGLGGLALRGLGGLACGDVAKRRHRTRDLRALAQRVTGHIHRQRGAVGAREHLFAPELAAVVHHLEHRALVQRQVVVARMGVEDVVPHAAQHVLGAQLQHLQRGRVHQRDVALVVQHVQAFGHGVGDGLEVVALLRQPRVGRRQPPKQRQHQQQPQRGQRGRDRKFALQQARKRRPAVGQHVAREPLLHVTHRQQRHRPHLAPVAGGHGGGTALAHELLHVGALAQPGVERLRAARWRRGRVGQLHLGVFHHKVGVDGGVAVEPLFAVHQLGHDGGALQHEVVLARFVKFAQRLLDAAEGDAHLHAAQVPALALQRVHIAKAGLELAGLEPRHRHPLLVGDAHRRAGVEQQVAKLGRVVKAQQALAIGQVQVQLAHVGRLELGVGGQQQLVQVAAYGRAPRFVQRRHARDVVEHLGAVDGLVDDGLRHEPVHVGAGAVRDLQAGAVLVQKARLLVLPVVVQPPHGRAFYQHKGGQKIPAAAVPAHDAVDAQKLPFSGMRARRRSARTGS